ncbi:hybrid sensor histidine kinase/response regulator, partial [Mesorhizobium sp. M2E.F.Ca.ET.209.01.1.1]
MIAESVSQRADPGDDIVAAPAQAPAMARRFIAAPPLVPDQQPAKREGLPILTFVVMVLAGLSYLTGAPVFITIGLLATGLGGLAMH